MKSFKNFIITIILTLVMSSIVLWGVSKIFIPKWITHDDNMMSYIIKGFYKEPKNSLDIIFTGNSDVYRGISPMELYNETGITSYNFVSAGQRMWIAYPMLEEALKTQNPKIVFFNVDEVFFTHTASVGNYHKVYDNLPFGITKIKGVFDSSYDKSKFEKMSHFMPIFAYHSRYSELTKDDFKYAFYDYTNVTKGLDLVAFHKPYIDDVDYMKYTDEVTPIPDTNKEYLDKMVKLCNDNDVEFVLMEVPSADSWNYKKSNAISNYANENNLKFIDFNLVLQEMNFDWSTDTSDGGDHLNIYGAEKVTKYLADYLKDNYDFKSHKDDRKYSKWIDEYKKYLDVKQQEINLQK